MRIQKKHEQLISTLITSLGMGFFMSLAFTLIFTSLNDGFFLQWGKSFILGTSIAFPTTLVVTSIAEKITNTLAEKYQQSVYGMIMLFGIGSFVSLIFTMILTGLNDSFFLRWAHSFILAISIALPTVLLVVRPITRKLVNILIQDA